MPALLLSSLDVLCFYAVFRTTSASFLNTLAIQSTTNNMVTNTIQILNSSTSKQYNVALQTVTFVGYVGNYFIPSSKSNFSNFSYRRVRLLRVRVVMNADTSTKRASLKCWDLVLVFCKRRPFLTNWLIVAS